MCFHFIGDWCYEIHASHKCLVYHKKIRFICNNYTDCAAKFLQKYRYYAKIFDKICGFYLLIWNCKLLTISIILVVLSNVNYTQKLHLKIFLLKKDIFVIIILTTAKFFQMYIYFPKYFT